MLLSLTCTDESSYAMIAGASLGAIGVLSASFMVYKRRNEALEHGQSLDSFSSNGGGGGMTKGKSVMRFEAVSPAHIPKRRTMGPDFTGGGMAPIGAAPARSRASTRTGKIDTKLHR
jgi:hypothetical protein